MQYRTINTDALYQAAVASVGQQAATFIAALYEQLNAAEQRGYEQGPEEGFAEGFHSGYNSAVEPKIPLGHTMDMAPGDLFAVDIGMRGMLSGEPTEEDAMRAMERTYDMHFGREG